jgi:hypothetical protein
MAGSAAHLVDAVVPAAPLRQYVLSLPYALSVLAATKPDVLRAVARIHGEELGRHYRAIAKRQGQTGKTHPGSVCFVQRFGSSLNLHVHLHVCALDGVFVDATPSPDFVPAPPPSREELCAILERVAARLTVWLTKKRYLKSDAELYDSNETPQRSFEEMLAALATQRGTTEKLRDSGEVDGEDASGPDAPRSPSAGDAVTRMGFNLHAAVTVAADDDMGRERLFRYGLRPPFALSRLRRLADGRMAYRIKKAGRGVAKWRVMTPVECIGRLCALVPPPRYPLTRFAGVLAPRAKLRPRIVPRLPESSARAPCRTHAPKTPTEPATPAPRTRTEGPVIPRDSPVSAAALARVVPGADAPAPNVLSAAHLTRIAGGLLYAATSRLPWATLLRRTFDIDISRCARCGGHVRVRAVITEAALAARILGAIQNKRARDPPHVHHAVA